MSHWGPSYGEIVSEENRRRSLTTSAAELVVSAAWLLNVEPPDHLISTNNKGDRR